MKPLPRDLPVRSSAIGLRLGVWYALWVLGLIAAASGLVYGGLATRLDQQEDARILADNLEALRLVLRGGPADVPHSSRGEPQIYMRVLDEQGRVVVESPGMTSEIAVPSLAELAGWPAGRAVQNQVVSASGKQFDTLSARVAVGAGGSARYLNVAMDRTADRVLANFRDRSWLLLTLSLMACGVVGYAIARRGISPIESIARTAQRIHSSTLHERIETAGLPRELAILAGTFNQMLDRIEASFERVSEFSDNVAHELRTPINNLQSEIEVTLRKARSEDDYRNVLVSCLEECSRISHIVQSLLFLARGESSPSPLNLEVARLRAELEDVRDFYEGLASDAGVCLEVAAPDDLAVRLDRTLFRQAVGNLVANAIEHTAPDGVARICAAATDAGVRISVEDTGCGIAPEHLPHVFERFYRVDRARPGSRRNAGLGLAIAKSIVSRHGGRIAIESCVGLGTTVAIDLPLQAD